MTSPVSRLGFLEKLAQHEANGSSPFEGAIIIGIAGGTASGKTTVCKLITKHLADSRVSVISQDCFYRNLTAAELANVSEYNFDHPKAFDVDMMERVINAVKQGRRVRIPEYDYENNCQRTDKFQEVGGTPVVLLEGILVLYYAQIRSLLDLKVFVWWDSDICLARRVERDIEERGRNLKSVLRQYEKFVKPAHEEFVYPSKSHADIIMPHGASNTVAMGLLVSHIRQQLQRKKTTNSPALTSAAGRPVETIVGGMPPAPASAVPASADLPPRAPAKEQKHEQVFKLESP